MLARNTYLEINLKNLRTNVSRIISEYNEYQYFFGVVKADSYGHGGIKTIKAIIQGGCDYLAVATLEEALDIRKKINEIPILCLGVVSSQYIETCIQNNITVTINSLEYLEEVLEQDCSNLKVHLKLNTGMNRLGVSNQEEIKKIIELLNRNGIILEGIYTHIYNAECEEDYNRQIEKFEELLSDIDISNVPIIHISASEALEKYERPKFVNGCRLGIIMYGFCSNAYLRLRPTMKLMSEVIQIHELKKGETVGYGGAYKASENGEKIAVVSIGYADGIIRKNTGRTVYINDKEYLIVGNICMDMMFVKVDDNVKVHDEVYVLKDIEHINKVAEYLDTIPYEVICSIGKRVTRIYK